MAMPVHKDALHDALTREHERQRMEEKMTDRDSKEILLDEEGVALKDLSHQRSQGNETRPAFHSTVPSSTNVVQKGWRRSTREETMRDHNPTDTLALGRLYERMGKLSIIPRYMVYIVPLGVLIAIPIIAGAFLPQLELGGVRIVWIFSWVEVVWTSLWASKIFAKLLPFLFRHIVGFVSASTAKYATIIAALEVPVTLLSWTFVSFITFIPMMTRNPTQQALGDSTVKDWEGTLRQILAALCVTALVYLIEKTFIQFIAVNFHKVSYEERIRKNKASVHILARLYEQSRALFPTFTHDFAFEDAVLFNSKARGPGHRDTSGTATPTMRAVLGGAKKAVNKATSAFGSAAQEITGKQIFQPNTPYNTVVEALATTATCTSLARRLWYSFAAEGEQVLHKHDFEEVLGNPEEANEAMLLFDKDGNGDVNLEEAELVVNEISKERKSLTRSMRDVDFAIRKLDDVFVGVVFIVMILVFIAFLNTNFATTLATAGTALLSLSFIFATTCQEILASILFLFYKHPFDVGDRVDIAGSRYIVKELSLLFTIFKRLDGTIVQVNNAVLNTIWIDNIARSATMSEAIQIQVDFGTSFAAIQRLRREMLKFVEENSRDYAGELEIEIQDAKGLDKLLLQIVIKHKSNWQNDALRAHRRNKFMCALIQGIRKVGIVAGGPGLGDPKNPMYIVRQSPSTDGSTLLPSERQSSRPPTRDTDMSFGQKRQVVEDPSTNFDDGRQQVRQEQLAYSYYNEDELNNQMSGTSPTMGGLRADQGFQRDDIERGRSFGRRRKPVPGDLESGAQH